MNEKTSKEGGTNKRIQFYNEKKRKITKSRKVIELQKCRYLEGENSQIFVNIKNFTPLKHEKLRHPKNRPILRFLNTELYKPKTNSSYRAKISSHTFR